MGVMAVVAEVIQEWTRYMTSNGEGLSPLITSIIFLLFLLILFWSGKHNIFMQFVALMVGVMGIAFILTNFMIIHDPGEVISGLVPHIPATGKPHIIIAGMVGTTMAAVVLVSRSSVVAEKKWQPEELKIENRDSIISVTVLFIVSAAIMASAAGTLYQEGIMVDNAIDMVKTLEPLAGRFAIAVFVTGIIAAGLSSIFPNILLLPWLICDYRGIKRNLKATIFRVLAVLIACSGLIIPVFGGKPVVVMLASQAFSPLMMPLLILFLLIMMNKKKVMKEYVNGFWLNMGMVITFLFSIFMFFIAFEAYIGLLD